MTKQSVKKATVEGPARTTEEAGRASSEDVGSSMRESELRAIRVRRAIWGCGLYPLPIEKRKRKRAREVFLEGLARCAEALTAEDLMALYMIASLWKFFPATSAG